MNRLVVFVNATLVVAVFAAPASAVKPTREHSDFVDRTFTGVCSFDVARHVEVNRSIITTYSDGTVRITGTLKNMKATEGSTVTIRFSFVDIEGNAVGEGTVTATAPAAEQTIPFEGTAPVTGEVAGWKYTVGS